MPNALTQPAAHGASPMRWSLFLAVSWTWCIGMVFPSLMVRDYTGWGWVVFAVPNVIGAAAVGFVNYGRHRAFLVRHRAAMGWFSAITIMFHIFVAGWLVPRLIGPIGSAAYIVLTMVFWQMGRHEKSRDHWSVRIAWWVSIAAAAVLVWRRDELVPGMQWSIDSERGVDLACLAPGIALGFLVAPHLDLTLHRARRGADEAGLARRVFAYGFGVLFLSMIVLSLIYARTLDAFLGGWKGRLNLSSIVCWALGMHLVVQSAITSALHLRHLPTRHLGIPRRLLPSAILVAGLLALGRTGRPLPAWTLDGELIYRVFLGAYGYVFPAYVLVAMVARRHEVDGPSVRTWLWVGAIVVAATPMFAMAFLWGHEAWTLGAVGVVVMGAWVSGWGVRKAELGARNEE